jgi:hypothetical protein
MMLVSVESLKQPAAGEVLGWLEYDIVVCSWN